MSQSDLVLLHPPSVYDFRQKTILYGPVSDLIPSSPIFEMYPIGFTSIAEYLERAGYQVRIVNLAVRMLNDRNFNAEAFIKRLRSPLFGIDLHWLVHAHGAIEIAKLVKRCHPEAKVVVGGLSASYYYQELLEYPERDYVLRGDFTEEPFRQLMDCITSRRQPEMVPNLVWRDSQGRIQENLFRYIPADLSNVMVNHYDGIIRSIIRHRDLASYIPFKDWLHYPITAVLTCRGCIQNCVVCGGSASAFRHFYNREKTGFRSPQSVVQDVKQIGHFSNGPIFILGDLRQPGEDYAYELLSLIQRDGVKNQLILELFSPASGDFLHQVSLSCPGFCLEISPESHNPEVRRAAGKPYSNRALEQTLSDALNAGCSRLDVFFMIGLPKQTPQSVMDTIDYCDFLLQKFRGDKRLSLFIAPLASFLDPGSLGFEQPQRYGYRILFRTLKEHRQALMEPSWKYTLNYETEWMNRHQIAEVTYKAGLHLNCLKAKHGLIPNEVAQALEHRIVTAVEMLHRIDRIIAEGGNPDQDEELSRLQRILNEISMSTMCHKKELELPTPFIKLKVMPALQSLLMKR